jgi:hypothetical protein
VFSIVSSATKIFEMQSVTSSAILKVMLLLVSFHSQFIKYAILMLTKHLLQGLQVPNQFADYYCAKAGASAL